MSELEQMESAGLYNKVDIHITTSGNALVYLTHNQIQIVPGALYHRPMRSLQTLRDYIKRHKYEVNKVVWI